MEFTNFNLYPELAQGIAEAGYVTCTPVQEQVLTHAFGGQDLYVQSQTGTGKTAAFLIVIFQRLLTEALLGGKKAIIMVPTRELAVQVEEEAQMLGRYLPFKTGSFYGGVGYTQQRDLLRDNVQILVGTPGRVLDLNESGQMNLMDIAFLVIDEADRMFDMGFYPDLRKLIRVVPPADRRQTMLFSATLNAYVKNLAWEYTKTPFEIEIEPETVTLDEVKQVLYHVPSTDKMRLLLGILERENPESAIIFCNTKRYTEIVAKRLRMNGYDCEFIIGDLPQVKRLKVIEDIKGGNVRFLVATDVAARGLDIEDLAMVVNFDLPNEAENYVHRIGRTARAGKTGSAVSLASEQDVYELPAIERYIGKKIPSENAGEELFGTDKSEGVRVQVDFYDGGRSSGSRDGRGSGERRSRRGEGRGNRDGRGERPEPRRDRGPEPRGEGERGRGNRGTRRDAPAAPAGRRAQGAAGPQGGPKPGSLSKLSFEERMAYYREKYGEGFGGSPSENREAPAGSAGAGAAGPSPQAGPGGAGSAGRSRGSRASGRGRRRRGSGREEAGAAGAGNAGSAGAGAAGSAGRGRGGRASARPGGERPERRRPGEKAPAFSGKGGRGGAEKAGEGAPKKGIFGKILGIFRKKD
ncbi:MAG: DEAD/DEAH box helicase [Treponema sp.]|jgi:ATP-dependent RNA helicase RhlB|nr:DEAD/DEAH box helicase [Treponema sp.]